MTPVTFNVGDDVWLVERRPYVAQKRVRKFDAHESRWKHSFVTTTQYLNVESPGWRIASLHGASAEITGMRLDGGRHVPVSMHVPLADLKPSARSVR